jgi:hypothetical protein
MFDFRSRSYTRHSADESNRRKKRPYPQTAPAPSRRLWLDSMPQAFALQVVAELLARTRLTGRKRSRFGTD